MASTFTLGRLLTRPRLVSKHCAVGFRQIRHSFGGAHHFAQRLSRWNHTLLRLRKEQRQVSSVNTHVRGRLKPRRHGRRTRPTRRRRH